MSEYIPTTEDMREWNDARGMTLAEHGFDRWLAANNATTRSELLDRIASLGHEIPDEILADLALSYLGGDRGE